MRVWASNVGRLRIPEPTVLPSEKFLLSVLEDYNSTNSI